MRKLTLVPALAARSVAGVSRPAQAKGPAAGVKRWPVPRAVVLRAVLAVIVSAALATTALAAPANAKVPGPTVKFSSPRFDPSVGDGVLYVMNPDGTGLHQVLRVGIECPNWSPDGSLIATCGSPDGAASRTINPGTGTYREVFASDPTLNLACPVWSPDGSGLPATSSPCQTIRAGRACTRSAHPMAAVSRGSPRTQAGRTIRWITRPTAHRSPSSAQTCTFPGHVVVDQAVPVRPRPP
jgi:WD40-like Beta Propeller Repeat